MAAIIKWVLEECFIPTVVSVAIFTIQQFFLKKDRKKQEAPIMYTSHVFSEEKLLLNKKKILSSKYIIRFYYQKLDEDKSEIQRIRFKYISYDDVIRMLKEGNLFLICYENIDNTGMCIQYLVNKQGQRKKIDENVVPIHISEDESYCLICYDKDIPASLTGTYFRLPAKYDIKSKKDDSFRPEIKKR